MQTFRPLGSTSTPANPAPVQGLPPVDMQTFHPLGQTSEQSQVAATVAQTPQTGPAGTSDIKEGEAEIPGATGFENTSASTSSGRGLPTAPKEAVNVGLKREASVGATIATLPFAPILTAGIAAAGGGALAQAVGAGGGMGFLNSVAEDIARGENPTEYHHLNKTAQQTVLGMVLGGLFHGAGAAYNAVTTPAEGEAPNLVQKIISGSKVAQAPAKSAMASRAAAANTGAGAAAETEATTNAAKIAKAEAATPNRMPVGHEATPHIPDEYKDAVAAAMKEGPAWTPEKAKPVMEALGDNFELKGSVSEGKSTANDLDVWQKSGKLSDAHPTLERMGFKFNADTPHGETWTKGDQHLDLWDKEHPPIKNYGRQPELSASEPEAEPEAHEGAPAGTPAGTPEAQPVVKSPLQPREALGPAITDAGKAADASYAKIDEVAGTDFKKTAQDIRDYNKKIFQAHNPTDAAAWTKKRDDAELLLDTAKNYAKAAGVGPEVLEEASSQFKRMSALRDVERFVYKNSSVIDPTTGEVNVKAAVRQLQKLQDNVKYGGPRLEQAGMGGLLEDMKAAQRLGIDALSKQQMAKLTAKIAVYTGLATGAAGGVIHALK
jgi:hypothetical protein